MKIASFVVCLLAGITCHAQDSLFRTVRFNGNDYFVADIDPGKHNIELFNIVDPKNSQHDLATIDSVRGKKLVLIVNGGMFQKDLRPLGLYISEGKTHMRIKRDTARYGNFYIQPNGIFIIDKAMKPRVITTKEYSDKSTAR
ncbi:MAG TPA: hypothetical protein VF473_08350, partial [Cyclobacteriaceae bacterium]